MCHCITAVSYYDETQYKIAAEVDEEESKFAGAESSVQSERKRSTEMKGVIGIDMLLPSPDTAFDGETRQNDSLALERKPTQRCAE